MKKRRFFNIVWTHDAERKSGVIFKGLYRSPLNITLRRLLYIFRVPKCLWCQVLICSVTPEGANSYRGHNTSGRDGISRIGDKWPRRHATSRAPAAPDISTRLICRPSTQIVAIQSNCSFAYRRQSTWSRLTLSMFRYISSSVK